MHLVRSLLRDILGVNTLINSQKMTIFWHNFQL